MDTEMNEALQAYTRSLSNPLKRAYTRVFRAWVMNGEQGPEPDRGELGAMAAQAVRLTIYEILNLHAIMFDFESLAAEGGSADIDDFDDILERLYDWGDSHVGSPTWPPNKLCWIKTF